MGVDKNMLVEFLQARSKDLCVDVQRERDNHFLDTPLCNRVYSNQLARRCGNKRAKTQ